jgi:Ala-tRNA(Pro) deacylase
VYQLDAADTREILMTAERVRAFLEEHGVTYEVHPHDESFTAQGVAAAEHESGWHVAKPVFVRGNRRKLAMFVVPAPMLVDLDKAAAALKVSEAHLADESEFADRFPDCETGAEPPFGNVYNLPVYVDERLLSEKRLVFAAGNHRESMTLLLGDYLRLVEPERVSVGVKAA